MKYPAAFTVMLMLVFAALMPPAHATSAQIMRAFQQEADRARLDHLVYWSGLVEEYKARTGKYPLEERLTGENPGLVRIATREQRQYFDPKSPRYVKDMDSNAGGNFQEFPVAAFVAELEKGLGRTIEEKYDIQGVPTGSPNYYHYFPVKGGYVMWTICMSCGVTQVSTLLMDGVTPTVNIVSPNMEGKVTKALTRDKMLANDIFKSWMARPYQKEGFVRAREKQYAHDSKTQ